ncbi:hypothetical protein BC832DRAFT_536379 [Gaertneriomyces semiglobifer]|nr:hypothetical protein BC832DRAFT_536379 [Gaertneriomyces semiglobifer]
MPAEHGLKWACVQTAHKSRPCICIVVQNRNIHSVRTMKGHSEEEDGVNGAFVIVHTSNCTVEGCTVTGSQAYRRLHHSRPRLLAPGASDQIRRCCHVVTLLRQGLPASTIDAIRSPKPNRGASVGRTRHSDARAVVRVIGIGNAIVVIGNVIHGGAYDGPGLDEQAHGVQRCAKPCLTR